MYQYTKYDTGRKSVTIWASRTNKIDPVLRVEEGHDPAKVVCEDIDQTEVVNTALEFCVDSSPCCMRSSGARDKLRGLTCGSQLSHGGQRHRPHAFMVHWSSREVGQYPGRPDGQCECVTCWTGGRLLLYSGATACDGVGQHPGVWQHRL
jgi:hypothetical protein